MPVHDPQPWRVPVDEAGAARRDLAAVDVPPPADGGVRPPVPRASDARQQARDRAERTRSRRAAGAGKARSYAFRRS